MKLMIRYKGRAYFDCGPYDDVMDRLRAICPNGRLIEALHPEGVKLMNQVIAVLDRVVRDAIRQGQFQLAETARELLNHIRNKGEVSMQDADAASFLSEALNVGA